MLTHLRRSVFAHLRLDVRIELNRALLTKTQLGRKLLTGLTTAEELEFHRFRVPIVAAFDPAFRRQFGEIPSDL